MVDPSTLRMMGPWVLMQPMPREAMSSGGILLPEEELLQEKIGLTKGLVRGLNSHGGYWEKKPNGKERWVPFDIRVGQVVCFRWYLKEDVTNPGHGALDDDHCFIHAKDIYAEVNETTRVL